MTHSTIKLRPIADLMVLMLICLPAAAAETIKPSLHGRHWVAITGKPPGATAGARMFHQGGNAVDAACAMLAVTCTMFDGVSWGGETQALIYDPRKNKVVGINGLGVAPTGATAEFFRQRQLDYPPSVGPLAAVTPGNPGGLMVMLAEYGRLSLADVLRPAIEMAEGYPIEAELARSIENNRDTLKQWPYSKQLFFPHLGQERETPRRGEIFRQLDLRDTLEKLVVAESRALREGSNRKQAIHAAYDRFYRGDIAAEFVRSSQEQGGLHTLDDLAQWEVKIEEPVHTNYKGIDVYKLTCWTQGPVMLQGLNMLEQVNLKEMGYNSARYIHTLYQVMNLAYADRDFYYGDPFFPPEEPIRGLLSKEYARHRFQEIDWKKNDTGVKPGDPYPFEGRENPFTSLLGRTAKPLGFDPTGQVASRSWEEFEASFLAGTTSIQAVDKDGWAVSVTPSGGWIPACIAGRTGIGMSQRMQSFVLDEQSNPFNVTAPGKRPRVTLTPALALQNDLPLLCFSVQGGDTQDQNLLQFFLNIVEFGMSVQEACEAANITSYQMHSSFGHHEKKPGRLRVRRDVPEWVRDDLEKMGYKLDTAKKTSGPITAIYLDQEQGSFEGGASNYGEDYGIAW